MKDSTRIRRWLGRVAAVVGLLVATLMGGAFLLSRADGPVLIFAGGPLRSGEPVAFADLDWTALDAQTELELEIVGARSSLTLWFSVHEGIPYVACDLDCFDGKLERWPQQIELDDRVVVRIDGKRIDGRLIHVPHGSAEYEAVRAGRLRKYSGEAGGRAASEAAAHNAVVEFGEVLTGRSKKTEPGDRLYRLDPR